MLKMPQVFNPADVETKHKMPNMTKEHTCKLDKPHNLTWSAGQTEDSYVDHSSCQGQIVTHRNVDGPRRLSAPAVPLSHRPWVFGSLIQRRNRSVNMKKSDANRIPVLKGGLKNLKVSKSPNLPKKQASPDNVGPSAGSASKSRPLPGSLQLPPDEPSYLTHSTEDLDSVEVSSRENGSSSEATLDDGDSHPTNADSNAADAAVRANAAIEHLQTKVRRTMEQIKQEQKVKEENVNEYLKLAASADRGQLQRIKNVFERKNQKSTQTISQLQKKLENYTKRCKDIEQYGLTGHKQPKELLRDMGQGLKNVGGNIVDGITGFSGGVVDNFKGAKDTIVSKPKEFAHLIKNRFGSADNIAQLKALEENRSEEPEKGHHGSGTLPAGFKYSDEDNSSITSGSGYGHSSPQSASQNISQPFPPIPQPNLEPLIQELHDTKEFNRTLQESIQRLIIEFDGYKSTTQSEIGMLRSLLEEEKFRVEHLEEQMNDVTELHQNEVTNLKQDISSMEEKIEYRLEERTTDLHDLLENCQTRITKMELQQQQQQIISMEMVENVTFRTLLTKLINVVLAILAVILVFVSTAANLIAPFLTTRARILSTVVLICSIAFVWQNWEHISAVLVNFWEHCRQLLPQR